ncbi:MAG: hypothetical protein JXR37_14720 [Kiritimatiellae bacterium]|nr:hypothetical protein [Kiritimatiellia bacterium]
MPNLTAGIPALANQGMTAKGNDAQPGNRARPEGMTAPDSYLTNPDKVAAMLDSLSVGKVVELGTSYGGRPIRAVGYGAFEPIDRRSTHSAAYMAGQPEAFFGKREKRVLLISSAVHGAEIESIAGVMNLISILERGSDLDGVEWPGIAGGARRLRIVIVPIANPDGRARVPSDDQLGWSADETQRYRHGADAAGTPLEWRPACFVPHPQILAERSVLGGYFNDAGVNPSQGMFLARDISPEAHLLADLAYAETADCYLELHSCGAGPLFLNGWGFVPAEMTAHQHYIDGAWRMKMRQRGLPAPDGIRKPLARKAMGLIGYVYHKAGSLPLLFEGGAGRRYSGENVHRQIVDTYLTLFETLIEIGVRDGYRPAL